MKNERMLVERGILLESGELYIEAVIVELTRDTS